MKPTTTNNPNNPNNRNSFIFYRSFFETIGDLNDADQLEIYRAIAEYSLNDKSINLTGFPKTIFRLIEPQLIANKRRFKNGCLGAEHGAKGGRPKSKKTPKKPLKNPKLTPNKNNNDNLNEELESKLKNLNVNQDTWKDFVYFRDEIKKPLTDRAIKLIFNDLAQFESNQAGSANLALENSIKNSWQGVFEPKPSQSKQSIQDPLANNLNKIAGGNYFQSVTLGDVVKITCVAGMKTKAYSLPTETKDKIKAQFKQPIEIK
jgi:hypothetical protein